MNINKTAFRFGVLFDGSAISEKVLAKTIAMMSDVDRLTIITVVEPGLVQDGIRAKINAVC